MFNVTVLRSFASENVQMLGPVGVVLTPRNAGLRSDFSPSCIQLCCKQWLDGPLHKSGLREFRKQKGKFANESAVECPEEAGCSPRTPPR